MSAPPPGLSGSLGLGGGAYPTLCFRCHTMVLLTAEQAVVTEAERIALDVVSVAFCRCCVALSRVEED